MLQISFYHHHFTDGHVIRRYQRTATNCNTLQHSATHRNTPQYTATHSKYPPPSSPNKWACNQKTATYCNILRHTATHCNTLQHTATYCNTLQHTATHCNTQVGMLSEDTASVLDDLFADPTDEVCETRRHSHPYLLCVSLYTYVNFEWVCVCLRVRVRVCAHVCAQITDTATHSSTLQHETKFPWADHYYCLLVKKGLSSYSFLISLNVNIFQLRIIFLTVNFLSGNVLQQDASDILSDDSNASLDVSRQQHPGVSSCVCIWLYAHSCIRMCT